MTTTSTSWLDSSRETKWAEQPYFRLTVDLLKSVRDQDLQTLSELSDDDFGMVDLDQGGDNVMMRTRAEWEAWFHRLFAELDAAGASTHSEITQCQALESTDLGYSVVEFRQSLSMNDEAAYFDCVATIIWKNTPQGCRVWKNTPQGWNESPWHLSLLSSDVPARLMGAGS